LRSLILPAVAALLSPATLAWSAEAPPGTHGNQLTELSLEELMEVKVVYAASLYEQTLLEAPSSVSIITAEEIEAFAYRDLAEILAGARGIFTTNDRNYQYAGIRGFARPGDYNSRILLLLDGHRLNENIYDSATIGGAFPLDVGLIERVEIVRGPASSIYGTSAFFGVVNVVTKQGATLGGVELTANAGSFDTLGARLDYGERFANGVEFLASASGLESAGQDLYFPEFDDPASNRGVAVDSDREEIERSFLQVAARGLRLQATSSSREKRIPTGPWETVFNDPRTYTVDRFDILTLEYSRPAEEDRFGFLWRMSYNDYEYAGEYVYDYGEEDEPYLVINYDSAAGSWWGAEFRVMREFAKGRTLAVGAEFRDNSRQKQRNADEEVYLDDSRSSHSRALFVQGELPLGDKLRLNAGLRYDDGDQSESFLSPRTALIWTPRKDNALKFLYGRAFRSPNAYELYYNDFGSLEEPLPGSQKASLNLASEKITTEELVWEQKLAPRWRGLLSLYHYEIEDLITLTTDPVDELLVYDSLGRIHANGVEVEVEGQWRSGLQARWSYAYQDAEEPGVDGRLSNSPRNVGKLQLRSRLPDKRLSVAAEVHYLSSRRTLGERVAAAHTVANLSLSARLPNDRLRLTVGLYNLLDEQYADPGSEEHLQEVIAQNGRNWRLALTYRP
jgi:iron complex outermembrane receptor protein